MRTRGARRADLTTNCSSQWCQERFQQGSLLFRHRKQEALLSSNGLIEFLPRIIDVDALPVNFAGEVVVAWLVVGGDGFAYVASDFHGFVHREEEGVRAVDSALPDFLVVDIERDGRALAQTATVVG